MLAYHSNPQSKADILAQLDAHRAADQLVTGRYWQDGKGCAVGCTLHSGNHAEYESRFGIPRVLAHLEDRLFEGLPNAAAMEWPARFMGAIRPGADLAMVWPRFILWLLTEEIPRHTKSTRVRAALSEVESLYRRWVDGDKPSGDEWLSARKNADAAYAADAYAADAAAAAAAAYAADAAAADAADAAAAAAAYAAYAAARAKCYGRMADKLADLLASC